MSWREMRFKIGRTVGIQLTKIFMTFSTHVHVCACMCTRGVCATKHVWRGENLWVDCLLPLHGSLGIYLRLQGLVADALT